MWCERDYDRTQSVTVFPKSALADSCFRRNLTKRTTDLQLSVDHPLFECVPNKTMVAGDLERWNLTLASEFVDYVGMNLQMFSYFDSLMIGLSAAA